MTAYKPNELWNVDFFVMLSYKKSNDGFNYYLMAIDIFSRKAYGAKMKNKDSVSAREAMQTIITKENQPRSMLIDNDAGFFSNDGNVGDCFRNYWRKRVLHYKLTR